jgi:acetyltransferase-like isoleucine patch superfamily enzyme
LISYGNPAFLELNYTIFLDMVDKIKYTDTNDDAMHTICEDTEMQWKRLWLTLRSSLIGSSRKRTEYLKRHRVYHYIGENVSIHSRKIPLYANLISLHDNVKIAANVVFITHDITHRMLRDMMSGKKFPEKIGCIEVMDNVFIGANSVVLNNVRIGPNVIVAAGSVVAKDIPPGVVVGGVPAKVIGSFDDFVAKRTAEIKDSKKMPGQPAGHLITKELETYMWDKFHETKDRA